jgi:hypothetical protein
MLDTERDKWERSGCTGKRRYLTKGEAKLELRLAERRGVQLRVYGPCQFCGCFHHASRHSKRGRKAWRSTKEGTRQR